MEKNTINSGDVSLYEALNRQTAAITAMLEIQRELLQAVQGLSDDAIGSAADRYRQKMAVVNGGVQ